jgi:hypothetical protein
VISHLKTLSRKLKRSRNASRSKPKRKGNKKRQPRLSWKRPGSRGSSRLRRLKRRLKRKVAGQMKSRNCWRTGSGTSPKHWDLRKGSFKYLKPSIIRRLRSAMQGTRRSLRRSSSRKLSDLIR